MSKVDLEEFEKHSKDVGSTKEVESHEAKAESATVKRAKQLAAESKARKAYFEANRAKGFSKKQQHIAAQRAAGKEISTSKYYDDEGNRVDPNASPVDGLAEYTMNMRERIGANKDNLSDLQSSFARALAQAKEIKNAQREEEHLDSAAGELTLYEQAKQNLSARISGDGGEDVTTPTDRTTSPEVTMPVPYESEGDFVPKPKEVVRSRGKEDGNVFDMFYDMVSGGSGGKGGGGSDGLAGIGGDFSGLPIPSAGGALDTTTPPLPGIVDNLGKFGKALNGATMAVEGAKIAYEKLGEIAEYYNIQQEKGIAAGLSGNEFIAQRDALKAAGMSEPMAEATLQQVGSRMRSALQDPSSIGSMISRMATADALSGGTGMDWGALVKNMIGGDAASADNVNSMLQQYAVDNKDNVLGSSAVLEAAGAAGYLSMNKAVDKTRKEIDANYAEPLLESITAVRGEFDNLGTALKNLNFRYAKDLLPEAGNKAGNMAEEAGEFLGGQFPILNTFKDIMQPYVDINPISIAAKKLFSGEDTPAEGVLRQSLGANGSASSKLDLSEGTINALASKLSNQGTTVLIKNDSTAEIRAEVVRPKEVGGQ